MPLSRQIAKLPFWAQFVLNISLLYVIWVVFYKFLRDWWLIDYIYEEIIYWLTKIQLLLAGWSLSLFGYEVTIIGKVISINGNNGVLLDRGCLGRNVLGLFAGFILAYPSTWREKAWILPTGFIVFIVLNVLRIDALAITELCCPQYLDINHHYIFKIVVYTAILLMWWIWLKSLRPLEQTGEKHKTKPPQAP